MSNFSVLLKCFTLLLFIMEYFSMSVIPNILFRSFTNLDDLSSLDPLFKQLFNDTVTQNPEYVQVFFNGADIENFIRHHFIHFIDYYYALLPGAYKTDFFRLLLLYHYGGIYNDMGIRFIKRIPDVVRSDDEFVGAVDLDNTALINGWFAVHSHHPYIHELLKLIMENIKYRRYNCNNLDITGPKTWGRALSAFFCSLQIQPKKVGTYEIENYKFRFLQFHDDHGRQTITENGEISLTNKFEGYKAAIYRNGTESFGSIYYYHTVFNTSNAISIYSNLGPYEGKLLQWGKSINYIQDGKRRGFEDFDTFLGYGFETCMVAEKTDKLMEMPMGENFKLQDIPYCNGTKVQKESKREMDEMEEGKIRARRVRLEMFIRDFAGRTVDYATLHNFMSKGQAEG